MLASLLSDIKFFLSLVSISLIIILFDSLGVLSFPKSLVQTISTPIQYGLYKTSQSVFKQFEFIILARKASQENQAKTDQLAQILSENSRLRRELAEAKALVDQQNAISLQTFNLVAARPVGVSRYLILDKGSDDGIKANQVVIYKDNLIGKIKEVDRQKSQVLLSSDPDFKLAAFVSNNSGKAKGVLSGQFGAEMLLDKVLHQESLYKFDLVYTEGSEVEIPRGLILGQVVEVEDKDNEIFKKAKVKTMFDVTDLDLVFIITN